MLYRQYRHGQFAGSRVTVGKTTVTLDEEIYCEIDQYSSIWGNGRDLGKAIWSCTRPDGKRLALKAEAVSHFAPFNVTREAVMLQGPLHCLSHTASLVDLSLIAPFEPLGISYLDSGKCHIILTDLCGPDFGSRTSPLSLKQARMVTHGLLNALEKMHDAGVIHRNIKPGNVCLRTAPAGPQVSVTSLLSSVDLNDVVLIDCATAVTLSLCDAAHAAKAEFTAATATTGDVYSAMHFNLANHANFRDKPGDAALVENMTARGSFSSVSMLEASDYPSRRDDIECISYFLADILSQEWYQSRSNHEWSELKKTSRSAAYF